MLARRIAQTAKARPQRQNTQAIQLPPPVAGVNVVAPPSGLQDNEAIYLINFTPSRYGIRVRDGWQEWQVGLPSPARTVIPCASTNAGQDRLFVACRDGIYDVSVKGAAPSRMVAFGDTSVNAGWGTSVNFVGIGGHFVLFCDEVNGYHIYTASTGSWRKVGAGELTGIDPGSLAHVCVWKNIVWFVQRGTGSAWYLPVGQMVGAASEFKFGNRFSHGGELVGLFSYTVNGGLGVDEFLVAISRQGDVLIYQGSDPSSASSFAAKGSTFIGALPAGRQVAAYFGGELLILSNRGVTALSRVLGGDAAAEDVYASRKIAPLLAADMEATASVWGWSIGFHPARSLIVVSVPASPSTAPHQYAMHVDTGAWSLFRDIPMNAMGVWLGSLVFGTTDGRVAVMAGTADAVAVGGGYATSIRWGLLTGFGDAGAPGRSKRVHMIQLRFMGDGDAPSCVALARYGLDTSEAFGALDPGAPSVSVWDSATWGVATWRASNTSSVLTFGATGIGQAVAIAIQGASTTELSLAGIQVFFDVGGFL